MILPGIGGDMGASAQIIPGPVGSPTQNQFLNNTVFSMAYPANPKAANYALFWVATQSNTPLSIVSGPAGFTSLATSSSGLMQCYLYYRHLDGTESGSVSLTLSSGTGVNNAGFGSLSYWTGLAQSGTVFDGGTINAGSHTTAMAGTALTPGAANEQVLTLWGIGVNSTDMNSIPDTGWTNVLGDTWAVPPGGAQGGKSPIDMITANGATVPAENRTLNTSSISFWINCTIGLRPG